MKKIRKRQKIKEFLIRRFFKSSSKNCSDSRKLKQIYGCEYNGILKDEGKIFLYGSLCEKVVRFKCRSGEIILKIRSKIVNKRKEWVIVAVLFVTRILGLPGDIPASKFDFPVSFSSNTAIERVLDVSQGGNLGKVNNPGARTRKTGAQVHFPEYTISVKYMSNTNLFENSTFNEEKILEGNETCKSSIFVEGFQAIRKFPARPKINYFDRVEKRMIKPSVMLEAHLQCRNDRDNLPREIVKNDKTIKFPKEYSGLFKKNSKDVFGYDVYLEENVGKDSSKTKIKQAKQKLYKKYGEQSKKDLRLRLFENRNTIKSENCKYLDSEDFEFVTIYYDHMTDLFAIINPENNSLLDFGIATEVKYAEIFAYKSFGTSKQRDICFLPDLPSEEGVSLVKPNLESKPPDVVELSRDQAINLLERKYGSQFITVANGEFKIEEWQAVKKVEHAVCFAINPLDYGFSQDQAKEINARGGLVSYVQKGKTLPSLDLVRTFQNALKNFCEDRNQSNRNDESTFRGAPSITFCNNETRQVVIFDRETKIFITAYKLSERSLDHYLATGHIGIEK